MTRAEEIAFDMIRSATDQHDRRMTALANLVVTGVLDGHEAMHVRAALIEAGRPR